ncbi:MAG: hypothetical protein IJE25_09580 [Clostridia bacterium]|nr:hypothetical protein [Clostridia bacterium]
MTKTNGRFSKIITLAIGAVFALLCLFITAFASGADTDSQASEVSEPRIIAKNIAYSSELYTCYAVPCEGVASGASVELQVLKENGDLKATISDYSIESVHGIPCYVFRGKGTSPRNIGVTEYVRAVCSDGGKSEVVEYSVLEYLCEKLTKEAYLNRTPDEGKEYTRRELYLQLLKYSTSAEALLGSASEKLLSETCFIGAVGGEGLGFKNTGDTAYLTYDTSYEPLYREFVRWEVTTYDLRGNLIDSFTAENGASITASGFVCATPVYTTTVPDGVTAIFNDSHVAISVMTEDHFDHEFAVAEKLESELRQMVGSRGFVEIIYGMLSSDADVNIIIGESASATSAAAYARLAEIRSDRLFSEAKYVIKSSGREVAIAYDPNEYTDLQTVDYAAEELMASFIRSSDAFSFEDHISENELDLIAIQKEIDVAEEQTEWAELYDFAIDKYGEENGTAVVDAIKEYYGIRSDNLVVWYANLYDPGIGGFYASNSGKKYSGFMPLLETTGQLLGHLASYGVFSPKGNSSKAALPEHIRAQIIYYAKSCQDPESGYFYNPQLGKAETDKTVVRRGRDLSRVTSMLSSLGSKPTYDCPNGTKGDGITADEYWESTGLPLELKPYVPESLEAYESYLESLTSTLGADTEEAVAALVSYVALTSSTTEDSEAYLKSHASFAEYLDSKDIDGKPYSVGNEFNGTYKLIQVASDKLGAYASEEGAAETPWYEGMTLCDMLIDYMTRHINSKGLFGAISEGSTDELEGIKFENANGFFKMITIYNAWGVEYPEPMLAAKGLLTSIKGDEPSTGNVCNVYNSWNALSSLMSNVNKTYAEPVFTKEEKEAVIAYIAEALGDDGPAAIKNSYEKQKAYACEDGTFSNAVSSSAATFPGGLPAGLGGKEGNVDAIGFGFAATMNSIYSVMGLTSAKVSYHHDYHYLIFIEEILNVEPVTVKLGKAVNDEAYRNGWDNYSIDEYRRIATYTLGGEGNSVEFVDDGTGNTLFKVDKISGTTATVIQQYCTYEEENATKLVFGARIRIAELRQNAQIQFSIGGSSVSPFMTLCQSTSTSLGGTMNVNSKASTSKIGDWFDIRIEYQITARDAEGTPTAFRMDTYINDSLAYSTTSMYNSASTRRILELDEVKSLGVSFNQPNSGVFYIDDLYLHKVAE